MNNQDAGKLALQLCWPHEIRIRLFVPFRRRISHELGLDPVVVFRYLLGQGIVELETVEQSGRRRAANRELRCSIQEATPVGLPVNVFVVEVQHFPIEVERG